MKRYGDILSRKSLPVSVAELLNAELGSYSSMYRALFASSIRC